MNNYLKMSIGFFFEGFLIGCGFNNHSCEKKAQDVIKESPSQKIKKDLKNVNNDFRKSYKELVSQVYQLG